MQIPVYNQKGERIEAITLDDCFSRARWNDALIQQVVESFRANRRRPYAHVKDRGAVRGGGIKPWRQKGTGRARHGSIRSPIWIGGGVTHGPKNEKRYDKKINAKMKRKAFCVAIAQRFRDERALVVDSLHCAQAKTRLAGAIVRALGARLPQSSRAPRRLLFIFPEGGRADARAFRNIAGVQTRPDRLLHAYDVLAFPAIVLSKQSLSTISALARCATPNTAI